MDDVLTAGDLASELTAAAEPEQPQAEDSIDGEQGQENQSEEGQETEASDAEQSAEGEEEPAQEEQPEKDSSEVFLEWESNGEKIRVSQDELKNGYLRQQDYTQKTQNLARESQALQARVQQEFQAVQSMAAEFGQLANIDAQLQQYSQVNWQALKEQDPFAYSTALAEMNNLRATREDVSRHIDGKRQYMTQLQAQNFQQATAEAAEHLKKAIPNFGAETLKTMKQYGENLGFSAQELATVADKRMLQVLYEASQWRALQDKKPALQNKVKALPTKATKPAAQPVPQKQVQLDKQMRRLSQTGKTTDFAALLNSL